jgi:hypothetical protein
MLPIHTHSVACSGLGRTAATSRSTTGSSGVRHYNRAIIYGEFVLVVLFFFLTTILPL